MSLINPDKYSHGAITCQCTILSRKLVSYWYRRFGYNHLVAPYDNGETIQECETVATHTQKGFLLYKNLVYPARGRLFEKQAYILSNQCERAKTLLVSCDVLRKMDDCVFVVIKDDPISIQIKERSESEEKI